MMKLPFLSLLLVLLSSSPYSFAKSGKTLYHQRCMGCHGTTFGVVSLTDYLKPKSVVRQSIEEPLFSGNSVFLICTN